MKPQRRSNLLLGCWAALAALPAFAGPSDVIQTPEPTPQSSPDQILSVPEQQPERRVPPPPPEDIVIESESGISSTPLEQHGTLSRIGLISPANAGLPESLWRYSPMDETLTLLGGVPNVSASHVLFHTYESMLMLAAAAPRGDSKDWLIERSARLAKMGNTQAAADLLEQAPEPLRTPELWHAFVLREFAASQPHNACHALPKLTLEEDKAAMLQSFCDAIQGRFEKTDFAISVRQEAGTPFPAWFVSLIESLQYPDTRMESPTENISDFEQIMTLAVGDSRLPKGLSLKHYLANDFAEFHQLITDNPSYSAFTRAAFMEQKVAGGEDAQALSEFYNKIAEQPRPSEWHDVWQRAQAFASLSAASSGKQRMAALAGAFHAFADRPALMAELFPAMLADISDSTDLAAAPHKSAPLAFKILMLAEEFEGAKKWLAVMDKHQEKAVSTYVAYELVRLYATNPAKLSREARKIPPFTLPENPSARDVAMLRRYYLLAPLFGFEVPDLTVHILEEVAPAKAAATPSQSAAIESFATQGNLAGVVLSALSQLGTGTLSDAPDALIAAITSALLSLGQEELAKRFAIEATLAFIS